jgi:hypothetical protein
MTRQEGQRGERMETSPLALVSIAWQREDGLYGTLDPVDADRLSEDLRGRCAAAIARYGAEYGTAPNTLVSATTSQVLATAETGEKRRRAARQPDRYAS